MRYLRYIALIISLTFFSVSTFAAGSYIWKFVSGLGWILTLSSVDAAADASEAPQQPNRYPQSFGVNPLGIDSYENNRYFEPAYPDWNGGWYGKCSPNLVRQLPSHLLYMCF